MDSHESTGASAMDEEIIELETQKDNIDKDYTLLQDKFKRINIVNDQVSGWAKRVYGKFSQLSDG